MSRADVGLRGNLWRHFHFLLLHRFQCFFFLMSEPRSACREPGGAEEGAFGEREGGLPDHGGARDQDPASTQPPEHRQPDRDRHRQAGRVGLQEGQRSGSEIRSSVVAMPRCLYICVIFAVGL